MRWVWLLLRVVAPVRLAGVRGVPARMAAVARRCRPLAVAGVLGVVVAVTNGVVLSVAVPGIVITYTWHQGAASTPGQPGTRTPVGAALPGPAGVSGCTACAGPPRWPERGYQNSMAAFDDAISLHLDFVETDVRHSADGVAVLLHDPLLPPACYPYTGVAVRALTSAQLTQVRCAGQPVPRRTDLVARLSRPDAVDVGLMAEVKDVDPLGIRDALAPLGWRRTIVESFDWPALASIERATPQVPTCPLGVTDANLTRALLVTHDCIGPEQHAVTADLVTRAHNARRWHPGLDGQ